MVSGLKSYVVVLKRQRVSEESTGLDIYSAMVQWTWHGTIKFKRIHHMTSLISQVLPQVQWTWQGYCAHGKITFTKIQCTKDQVHNRHQKSNAQGKIKFTSL